MSALVLMACVTVVAGCSAAPPPPAAPSEQIAVLAQEAEADGFEEQAELLAGGEVSRSQLESAFARLASCMQDAGLTISEPFWNPAMGNSIEYSVNLGTRKQSEALADLEACEAEHWRLTAAAYRILNPPETEEVLRRAVAECLQGEGATVRGSERSVIDFVDSANDEDVVFDCYQQATTRLYPDAPATGVGY